MIFFFEGVHERWVGITFPDQQVQRRSFFAAGTEQDHGGKQ